MPGKVKKILITEEIPSKNKGEAAILIGMLKAFRLVGLSPIEISMLCVDKKNNDFDTRGINLLSYVEDIDQKNKISALFYGVNFTLKLTLFCIFFRVFEDYSLKVFKNRVFRAFVESDVLICGHDGIIEGLENKGNHFNKIVMYLFIFYHIILIKIFLRRKVCIVGASVGPFRNWLIEIFAKISLSMVDLVTVRDPRTLKYLEEIGLKNNLYLTADFAYLMEPEKIDIKDIMNNKDLLIGFTVTTGFHLYFDSAMSEKSKYIKYIQLKAKILDFLIERYHAKILFVPHAIKRGKDDRIIAKDIIREMNFGRKVIFLEDDFSPEELKYIISKCDFFIGERTHSNIAATSTCVPGISISEPGSHRNSMFFNLWGKQAVIEVGQISFELLKKRIAEMLNKKNELKLDLAKKSQLYRENAKKNAELLKALLNE